MTRRTIVTICAAALMACGKSEPPAAPTPRPVPSGSAGGTVTISIVANSGNQSFTPNPAAVPAGQTVVFRNNATGTHRIVADNGTWDTGTLASGASSPLIGLGGAAPIPYHCAIHAGMVGTINPGS